MLHKEICHWLISPGVADVEIAKDVNNVYKYTAKGNLVAVITNGAVSLGSILVQKLQTSNGRKRRYCLKISPILMFSISEIGTRHR
jgi:hypothetical protein